MWLHESNTPEASGGYAPQESYARQGRLRILDLGRARYVTNIGKSVKAGGLVERWKGVGLPAAGKGWG